VKYNFRKADMTWVPYRPKARMLALMDGTTDGTGAGPRMIRPVIKNVILPSADQVAIDAVAAKLMGFDPMSIR